MSDNATGGPTTTFEVQGHTIRMEGATDSDHIFGSIRSTGQFYEFELLDSIQPLLSPGDLVLDAGANIGNHSIHWGALCKAQVLAFEPEPEVFTVLRRNIRHNDLIGAVHPRNFALGDRDGSAAVVRATDDNVGQSRVDATVSGPTVVRRLDGLADVEGRTVRLIKVDVEGMEVEVLRGATAVLERDHPALLVECLDDVQYRATRDLLVPLGYGVVDCFNASPTYLFLSPAWAYPSSYSAQQHQQDIVGRLARGFVLMRNDVRAMNRRIL